MLNEKHWYQSVTIKNSLIGAIVSILALITAISGKVFNIAQIQIIFDQGWALVPLLITTYTSIRAVIGRKNAYTIITKKKC